ncbi:hypothetical protein CSB45_00655 [candidate division KSB3 bacterium]|uniref:Uncharacterized protein n=1 Tax=candidate division KSB3 bacterium TaxID=2044937 RepID=A0A2G6EEK0_9BACT|nr:MAG: hypothetical protein CSB45_00655 [candidate division KSB3 bacterium]PIE31061.1 MAG: hypothetical protein CSA57_00345 [candidate division KSB3 bacterium]
MPKRKVEIRLLFSNGKEDVFTIEAEDGDERLEPSFYLGAEGKEASNIEHQVIRVGNKAYRSKFIIFAEIIEEQGRSLGAYV